MKISVSVKPGRIDKIVAENAERAQFVLDRALEQIANTVESEVRSRAVRGPTGNYIAGVGSKTTSKTAEIGSKAPHAHLVESGRKPGKMPPPVKIAALLGLPAGAGFLVARRIGRHGTRGHRVLEQAMAAARPEVKRISSEARREIGRLR